MKLREYYIEEYRNQKRELTEKGELWRLCVETEEQFIDELNGIYVNSLVSDYFNVFHKESQTEGGINLLLQKKATYKEIMANQERLEKANEISDKKYIPYVKEQLKTITTPIEWENIVRISKWIFRKQITFNDLNYDIQKEFKMTKQYERLKLENKLYRKTLDND